MTDLPSIDNGRARPITATRVREQPDSVAILLCTFNGQLYLGEQLESFTQQTHANWALWASDDGSRDATKTILKNFQTEVSEHRVHIQDGPQQGFAANFMALTCQQSCEADFYAFADQDDIWEHDKLARALHKLRSVPKHVPALYCSRTRLIDASGTPIGLSPLFRKPPSFGNALIQNIGGGNTMLFNHCARMLLCEMSTEVEVVSQDWWTYMVVSGCGGQVFYDAEPSVKYRQHSGNLVGENSGWQARALRIKMLMQGRFKAWSDINTHALQRHRHRLLPESQLILDRFCAARKRGLLLRLIGIMRSGVYRQTRLGTLSMLAAAVFKKI